MRAGADEGCTITYQWLKQDPDNYNLIEIEGADSSSYTTEPITARTEYECVIRLSYDGQFVDSDYIFFYISIDNGFRLNAKNGQSYLSVEPNGSLDLEVVPVMKYGGVTLQWYDADTYQPIEGAVSKVLHLEGVTRSCVYVCEGSDDYGGHVSKYFYVSIDNKFSVRRIGSSAVRVESGGSATFKVEGSCKAGDIHYEWFKAGSDGMDDVLIPDAASAEYTTPAITKTQDYYCVAYDDYGNSETIYFTAMVDTGLKASLSGDSDVFVLPNDTATFTVEASLAPGNGEIHYQWKKRSDDYFTYVDIEGATSSSYTTEAVTANGGSYECVVSDDYGNAISLYVNTYIDSERIASPKYYSIYVDLGEDAVIEVVSKVDDPQNVTYSWIGPNNEILSETGPSITVTDVRKFAMYRFYATYRGYTVSTPVVLSVDSGFDPVCDPGNTVFGEPGTKVTLKVDSGYYSGNVTYVWYNDGNLITGETGSSIDVTVGENYSSYRVTATDDYGNEHELYFYVGPTRKEIELTGGGNVFVPYNTPATLSVGPVEGNDVTYKWYDQEGQTVGENAPSITTGPITKSGRYYCEVYADGAEGYTSFFVTVESHLTADAKNGVYDFSVPQGGSVDLEVVASADTELRYEWYSWYNSTDYSDVNGPKLTLSNVQKCDYIECDVYDEYGYWYWVTFYITVENGFTIGEISDVSVAAGERAEIAFDVTCDKGDITYSLRDPDNYNLINCVSIEDGKIVTTRLNADRRVMLVATDKYGTELHREFTIHVLPPGGFMKGDVNGDGVVDSQDSIVLARFVAKIDQDWDSGRIAAGDINGDGDVNANDLTLLSRYVARIVSVLGD